MSKHTPGPWIQRGERVDAQRNHVCGGVNQESVLALSRPPEERLANARLIAAAPEMLEALQAVWSDLESWDVDNEVSQRVRAAIAKATGGSK